MCSSFFPFFPLFLPALLPPLPPHDRHSAKVPLKQMMPNWEAVELGSCLTRNLGLSPVDQSAMTDDNVKDRIMSIVR